MCVMLDTPAWTHSDTIGLIAFREMRPTLYFHLHLCTIYLADAKIIKENTLALADLSCLALKKYPS